MVVACEKPQPSGGLPRKASLRPGPAKLGPPVPRSAPEPHRAQAAGLCAPDSRASAPPALGPRGPRGAGGLGAHWDLVQRPRFLVSQALRRWVVGLRTPSTSREASAVAALRAHTFGARHGQLRPFWVHVPCCGQIRGRFGNCQKGTSASGATLSLKGQARCCCVGRLQALATSPGNRRPGPRKLGPECPSAGTPTPGLRRPGLGVQ